MVDVVKSKAGTEGHEHGKDIPKASRFSRMKGLVASIVVACSVSGAPACGDNQEQPPGIPTTDGGCQTDGDNCTDSGSGGDAGTGGDGGSGGKTDAGTGGMDSGTGGMSDGGTTDSGTGGSDSGSGGMDSGTGGMSDGGSDGGMGCMAASTGSFSGTINASATETVGGYVFTYIEEDNDGNSVFDISCGGMAVSTNLACPEDVETIVLDNPSGKRIRITPNAANDLAVQVSIVVENI